MCKETITPGVQLCVQDFRGYVMKNAVHNYLGKEEELVSVINEWI